jgi:hypothetical protein
MLAGEGKKGGPFGGNDARRSFARWCAAAEFVEEVQQEG